MKWFSWMAVLCAITSCGPDRRDGSQLASLQAKSKLGVTTAWKLDPALSTSIIQGMRDRAYQFCSAEKPSDKSCPSEQDYSLFEYSNAFRLVRLFRSADGPSDPFAIGHKLDPAAFERAKRYCYSIYEDDGSRDARGLGPCMSAAVGADFFGIVPVS